MSDDSAEDADPTGEVPPVANDRGNNEIRITCFVLAPKILRDLINRLKR